MGRVVERSRGERDEVEDDADDEKCKSREGRRGCLNCAAQPSR